MLLRERYLSVVESIMLFPSAVVTAAFQVPNQHVLSFLTVFQSLWPFSPTLGQKLLMKKEEIFRNKASFPHGEVWKLVRSPVTLVMRALFVLLR